MYFTPRLEQAFKPAKIVFISGGNDLASGLTPEQVLKDFNALMNQTPETLKEMGKYIKAES